MGGIRVVYGLELKWWHKNIDRLDDPRFSFDMHKLDDRQLANVVNQINEAKRLVDTESARRK